MLADEYGTASNIKSRVNRLSVLGAITSVQQRLKLYNKVWGRSARPGLRSTALGVEVVTVSTLCGWAQVPPNGLVMYCGTVMTDEGKEKKLNIDFEPFRPINTSLYLCDNKFHTEALSSLLEDDHKVRAYHMDRDRDGRVTSHHAAALQFGFIIMDGNGALFGTLCGNTREILHKFTVDLPKKHGRGGQSALRFARLRMEKRHNYVRKVRACSCLIGRSVAPGLTGWNDAHHAPAGH
jgi:peptide chain release factor subunit 1